MAWWAKPSKQAITTIFSTTEQTIFPFSSSWLVSLGHFKFLLYLYKKKIRFKY